MTATDTSKWTADSTLGPRQAKAFNEALSKYNWEAKTITEITDFGEHNVTPMFGGRLNKLAAELMAEIKEKHGAVITAANHKQLIVAIQDAQVRVAQNRPVEDKRTTPDERAERDRATAEREAKAREEATHAATLTKHVYGLAESSALVKRVLGVLFPATKFSVKSSSYSGGCSISAHWTDGPTGKQVAPILDVFACCGFDGMQDLKTYNKSPEWNGHVFNFSGDYVNGSRSVSAALLRECCERFERETGKTAPTINDDGRGGPWLERSSEPCGFHFFAPGHGGDTENPEGVIASDAHGNDTADEIVNQMSRALSKEAATVPYLTANYQDNGTTEELWPSTVVFKIILGEIERPRSESQAIVSTDGVTISENEDKDGIEITFANKPDRAVLDNLKAHGWRWSRFSSVWYHKRSADALAFAQSLAGRLA